MPWPNSTICTTMLAARPYAQLSEMSQRIVAAADQTGIGMTLLPVFYQYGGCDSAPAAGWGSAALAMMQTNSLRLWSDAAALIGAHGDAAAIGVAPPHSLRAVDPGGLGAVLSGVPQGPIHMHLAEQVAEVDEVQSHFGARPTEWLLANQPVDARWCLIHCTQMTGAETAALAATGAVAGLCPLTESNLGDGIFNGNGISGSGRINRRWIRFQHPHLTVRGT